MEDDLHMALQYKSMDSMYCVPIYDCFMFDVILQQAFLHSVTLCHRNWKVFHLSTDSKYIR